MMQLWRQIEISSPHCCAAESHGKSLMTSANYFQGPCTQVILQMAGQSSSGLRSWIMSSHMCVLKQVWIAPLSLWNGGKQPLAPGQQPQQEVVAGMELPRLPSIIGNRSWHGNSSYFNSSTHHSVWVQDIASNLEGSSNMHRHFHPLRSHHHGCHYLGAPPT